MYDFIGDIHGHAKQGGVYGHPTRKAFFQGDLIDSGPQVLEVLNIVIPMVKKGAVKVVMGNQKLVHV